jgi:hypothetical protein
MQTEKEIESAILDLLKTVPYGFFWKNNSGGVFDPTKRVFRKNTNPHIINGVPDILGLIDGMFIGIEVKKPKPNKTYPSKDQKAFIAKVESVGGIAFVARSVQDIEEFLENLCGDEKDLL